MKQPPLRVVNSDLSLRKKTGFTAIIPSIQPQGKPRNIENETTLHSTDKLLIENRYHMILRSGYFPSPAR
jgi:hypothetical protein